MTEYTDRDSRPIELYEFTDGINYIHRVTNYDKDVEYDGHTWESCAITRGEIAVQLNKEDTLQLKVSSGAKVVTDSIVNFQNNQIEVNIVRMHDFDPAKVFKVFQGFLINFEYGKTKTTLTCVNYLFLLNKKICKKSITFQCPHELYGDECRATIKEANFEIMGKNSDIQLIVDNPDVAGVEMMIGSKIYFPYVDGQPELESRSIIAVEDLDGGGTALTITISRPFSNRLLSAGRTILIRAGCDRTIEFCMSYHDNKINFGGFIFIRKNAYIDYNSDETENYSKQTEFYEPIIR